MDDLRLVTYCGLYCDLCSQRARTPQQAKALKDTLKKEGFEFWGKDLPGYEQFWTLLGNLSDTDKSCPGCRQGGGNPGCEIRKCIKEKKLDVCSFCEEYPCEKINGLCKIYPTLITDGTRLKQVGTETWLEEQKARKETGFAYCDIRYPYPQQQGEN